MPILSDTIDKLIIAIVQSYDTDKVVEALSKAGHSSTKISTTGGFLREGNTTLLIGTEASYVDEILAILKQKTHSRTSYLNPMPSIIEPTMHLMLNPVEILVGGATVFIVDIDRFARY